MSDCEKNICIIIPCHNESRCITGVISDLRVHYPAATLVVVNDASTDDTEKVIRGLSVPNLILLNLPTNLGIGGAVQTGLRYAADGPWIFAVKFDGDGQHRADEIRNILAPVETGVADLVVGSRFLDRKHGFKSTFMRRVGIRIFRVLSWILTGQLVTDNTSGFRAYNRRALEFAARNYPSFDYPEPEEVILFLHNGFRVTEVSVKMAERKGGKSSINQFKAVYYMIKVIFAVFMAAIRPKIERT